MLKVLENDATFGLPERAFDPERPPRVLLCGVFGPYGVDDAFGRKENIMELFHNQVTKVQGVASMRFQHRSFGLYFIAANILAPTTVLDFPTRKQFIRELSKGYDAVGISFIASNFAKAREMARLVRKHLPKARIVLGGHGAAVEGVEELIECDAVARGEGIRWMRAWLGERVDRPIHHPNIVSAENKHILGVPTPGRTGLIVTGIGCVNGCRFCATSHNFGKRYIPFLKTGRDVFEAACRASDEFGCTDFFVMDENFLKDRKRAMELIDEMERAGRYFNFAIFSSAETITAFGMDELVRLGVFWLWLGVESRFETYTKNRGVDMRALIDGLQSRGIVVLASGILFHEEHTPQNIEEDIDYVISLEPCFTQFMQFTPMPVTELYQDLKRKGLIDFSIPYEEWHGQKRLVWKHPHFTPRQTEEFLHMAFQKEFDVLGSGVMRMTRTHLRGLAAFDSLPDTECFRSRRRALEARARELRLLVPAMARFAHNQTERDLVDALAKSFDRRFGPMTASERALSAGGLALAMKYALRVKLFGDRFQPATHRQEYRQSLWSEAATTLAHWTQAIRARAHAQVFALPSRTET
ncbi:MAG: cobalamin B12-binding domain-containing protein [Deltaproteobacteria bacterium]|nr:cobalamin B12-binding domain-containing protein [Deltaproteobacteria bacterium]